MEFTVTVRNRRAAAEIPAVVNGNTDYMVCFDTDSEWDAFSVKTACFAFRRDGQERLLSVSFSGSRCQMPLLAGTDLVSVGLTAGDIRTTAPARIPCLAGITAYAGEPYQPETDFYHTAMQQLAVICGGFASGS